MENSGQWLENALVELSTKIETGFTWDADVISGLVSYCEMASPLDAKEYLDVPKQPKLWPLKMDKGAVFYDQNIIGKEAGEHVIPEYLKRRGHTDSYSTSQATSSTSTLQAYVKPPSHDIPSVGAKKQQKASKDATTQVNHGNHSQPGTSESRLTNKGNQGNSRKKKSGKVVSLAEASKGSIIFQQGKPCSCQARQHRLISNCLSCGKIVCEQEGEGPCNFCGALVLREGSSYAGLQEGVVPLTEAEAVAEAYAKRLVEYDRNSAARTTVIDDQSDYYEIENNTWLSKEEKELLMKKREEVEEAERAKRNKVVISFDLVGRKVLVNQDEDSTETQNSFLSQPSEERESTRIKPNPSLKIQPVFVNPAPRETQRENASKRLSKGLCLEITGRVQHDKNEINNLVMG